MAHIACSKKVPGEFPIQPAEPIAIIGIGCRLPGGVINAETFWGLLRAGVDAITEVPPARFDINAFYDPRPGTPGKIVTRRGGFLEQVDQFDPYFFGLSPREASLMDPQQRLLLEVAWEALEDGGQVPSRLADSPAGVFVGMCYNDYEDLMFRDAPGIRAVYVTTGGFRSLAAGRLSYILNLRGPSLTVDTACSSSLVAVHLACQSLRSGECSIALAGGANLILQPQVSISFSQGRMLAPDGLCKFADASADGFVRSEGLGMVVLKPLARAQADGDPIYAVIRGSAVNNDGKSSGAAKTPSRHGQEAVLREAYRNAGVAPADIQYVEAHGTGTPVGDRAELESLGAVLGQGRPADQPCRVGSVKTNLGHTEGASGIAGLIKVALCLKQRAIPPSLHCERLNPNVPWQSLPLVVQRELEAWPESAFPARAGVSNFGISATNAHVVLEEAPRFAQAHQKAPEPHSRAYLLPLSAHTPEALKALAHAYYSLLNEDAECKGSFGDFCYTASVRRSHHEYRLALVARSHAEAGARLESFLRGEPSPGMSWGARTGSKVVFVFPGQGSQSLGMGRQLLEKEPVFRQAVKECEQAMRPYIDWPLMAEFNATPESSRLSRIGVVQPVLFAIQVGLAALWRSWGVEPHGVAGHSMGEVAAAYVAGILSLEDASRIICLRSLLLERISGQGAMAMVELSFAQAQEALTGHEDLLSVAASNGPASAVLSGDAVALETVLANLQRQDVFCRTIQVDVASHSPAVEPLRAELLQALQKLQPRAGTVPFYSTVGPEKKNDKNDENGKNAGLPLNADYWMRNLREPVLFWPVIERLCESGHDVFIELSPHPILLPAIERGVRQIGREAAVLPSLRREEDDRSVLLESLGGLYTWGHAVDWNRQYPQGGQCVRLPSYPWQRERFWLEEPKPRPSHKGHPLLGPSLQPASQPGTYLWETQLLSGALPYVDEHRVSGQAVFPAAAYIEMALAAVAEVFGPGPHALEKIAFIRALAVPAGAAQTIQLVIAPDVPGMVSVRCFSRPSQDSPSTPWTEHMFGIIRVSKDVPAADLGSLRSEFPLADIRSRCGETISGAAVYQAMQGQGLDYGSSLQGITQLLIGHGEALGAIRLQETTVLQAGKYQVFPALLDACFQVALAALTGHNPQTHLPVGLDVLRCYESPRSDASFWGYARHLPGRLSADVFLLDDAGRVLVETKGLRFRTMDRHAPPQVSDWWYELRWERKERSGDLSHREAGAWLIFADSSGVGQNVASLLEIRGGAAILVFTGERYERLGPRRYSVNPGDPLAFPRLLKDAFEFDQTCCRGVIYLWSLQAGTVEHASLECASVLHLVHALMQMESPALPSFWLVTRRAQRVGTELGPVSIAQSPLLGLGRVIRNEHPELRCRRVDLSAVEGAEEIHALVAELYAAGTNDASEDEIALRGDARYVARLARSSQQPSSPEALTFRADATYLITGGLGALGLRVAQWMVERGARHLVLAGRTGTSAVSAVASLAAEVFVAGADVSRRDQLAELLADVARRMPPLRGIIHAAGVLDDGLLQHLDQERFQNVMAPKISGAWNLHTLTLELPLDFFVLFSSVAALLGTPGQGNYAAANAFLDALAHYRRLQGRPALSINWGPWAELGLAAAQSNRGDRLARFGLGSLPPAYGLEALERLLQLELTQIAVMPFDAGQWRRSQPAAAASSLLADLTQESSASPAQAIDFRSALLAAESRRQRRSMLERHIREQIAQVVRISPSRIGPQTPLGSLGLDSLMALECRNRLEAALGVTLPATVVWNYPTLASLVPYLAGQMKVALEDDAPRNGTPQLAHMTEQEAEDLLASELAAMGQYLRGTEIT